MHTVTADDSFHSLFQDFSKEVEGKSSLKSSVVTEGNQLVRLKKVDTVVLRSDLARIDTQWSELLTRIPVVQEKLHQVLSHSLNWLNYFMTNWITPSLSSLVCRGFHMGPPSHRQHACVSSWMLTVLHQWVSFQIQMEKLASRHAISELLNWISLMENITEEDEENLKSAVGSNAIQDYLQKYKVVNISLRF